MSSACGVSDQQRHSAKAFMSAMGHKRTHSHDAMSALPQ